MNSNEKPRIQKQVCENKNYRISSHNCNYSEARSPHLVQHSQNHQIIHESDKAYRLRITYMRMKKNLNKQHKRRNIFQEQYNQNFRKALEYSRTRQMYSQRIIELDKKLKDLFTEKEKMMEHEDLSKQIKEQIDKVKAQKQQDTNQQKSSTLKLTIHNLESQLRQIQEKIQKQQNFERISKEIYQQLSEVQQSQKKVAQKFFSTMAKVQKWGQLRKQSGDYDLFLMDQMQKIYGLYAEEVEMEQSEDEFDYASQGSF